MTVTNRTGRERHPLVLAVCFPVSVHAARWVAMLRATRFRVVVFPSVLHDYCPEFRFDDSVCSREDAERLGPGEIGCVPPDSIVSLARTGSKRRLDYRPPRSAVHVTPELTPDPDSLVDAVSRLQPDLVHSLELQHGGYLTLEARRRLHPGFPIWLASSWGSDVFLYRKLATHRPWLEEMARSLDGFHSDCARDNPVLSEMGFGGTFFPRVAASGAVDLADYPHPDTLAPTSHRRGILVKGYHNWAGRGLDILLAIHRIAPKLRGFRIRVANGDKAMVRTAEAMRREDGLDIAVDPYFPNHGTAIRRLAESRLAVGYGISDGISTTLLESMAVGTFCIQADTACGSEWIRPGLDGLVVPPHDPEALADAIAAAACDDSLVDSPVGRNREVVERDWNIRTVAPRVVAGYESLLQREFATSV